MVAASNKRRFWLFAAPALAVVFVAITYGLAKHFTDRTLEQAADRLQLLNTLRKQALRDYFETAETELTFWSLNQDLLDKQAELLERWNSYAETRDDPGTRLQQLYVDANPFEADQRSQLSDAGDGSRYSKLHAELHPLARRFVVERGYYDFFLISPEGNVFYTVEKESDFGTNLKHGPWRDTGLADVFRRAIAGAADQAVAFSDLSPYGPSANEPAMFMARAMKGPNGELLGVLAFQLPVDRIRSIMQFDAGMGDSGETYLVGQDRLMRSDSRFSQQSTILKVSVETEAVERALKGEQGFTIMPDYRGVPVLSAYDSTQIDGHRWAILAEIDEAEILQNAAEAHPQISGLMVLLYALAMGSLWFLRLDDVPQDEQAAGVAMSDSDIPDLPG
jgi:methyl-accepting chemotaxis protein